MSLYYYSPSQKKLTKHFFRAPKKMLGNMAFTFLTATLTLLPEISYAGTWTDSIWNFVKSPIDATLSALGTGAATAVFFVLEQIAHLFFWGAGLFLTMSASLLDISIQATISRDIYANLQVIEVGWTTIRDFSNMFFIFALLYIAIKTILGLAGSSTKRWVANLIIAAILINFSLFATKVVIDAGNVLAMGFWGKMSITVNGATKPSASMHIMEGLKVQTTFDIKDKDGNTVKVDDSTRVVIYLGGALIMLVGGYIFIAGAIMMVVRSVTLVILMIASPFAFLSFALPVGGGFANKWLSKLIGSTFVAPAFLAMLYLDIIIINGLDLNKMTDSSGSKFGGAFTGDVGSFPIIYNYLVVIILLLASLTVANSVSSGAGSQAGSLAKRYIGYGAGAGLAGGGMLGRQTLGRYGKSKLNNKDWVAEQNRLVTKGNFYQRNMANLKLATVGGASKATYDGRNSKTVGKALGLGGVSAGSGTKKSFETTGSVGSSLRPLDKLTGGYRGTEKEKELIDTAKSRYATDPEAQKAYLTQRGVQLDAPRNKEVSNQLKRDSVEKAQIAKLQDQLQKVSGLDMKGLATLDTPEKVAAMNTQIAEKITQMGAQEGEDFVKGFAQALDKLSSKKYAEMGSGFLDLDIVQRNTTGRQLSEVHTKLGDGTLAVSNADAYRTKLSQNIMWNGTDSAKSVMKNQIRQGNSNFIVDTQRELDWATTHPADEETREKNIKNAMSFMSYEDIARMDISKLQTIDPYLTDAHYKAMGKNKKEALKAAVAAQQQTP